MYDRKYKEKARAYDAVDKLRDIQERMKEQQEHKEKMHDIIVRSVLFALIVATVVYAAIQL